jgi:glycerol-3-phosphate acyltransferase PlsY
VLLNETMAIVQLLLAGIWGYLLGSVPTGVLICKALGAPDVRWIGSGHTGGTNVLRSAGPWAAILTAVVDTCLGFMAVTGALLLADTPWAATVAGVMAVVGHNWSLFVHFRGGIGLSSLFGALLGFSPLLAVAALIVLALLWLGLVKLLDLHRARATILVMGGTGPLLWVLGLPWPAILLGALGGVVVILKTVPDWNREYPT